MRPRVVDRGAPSGFARNTQNTSRNLYQLFIDFKQAYGSVVRKALLGITHELVIPGHLIAIVEMTLNGTIERVVLQNFISEPFEINTGLKQGNGLSGILFNLVLE
jgi:hypothetical protein